jgi:peroxiredoxin
MKKLIIFLLLAGFISACSQYTCPTYAKDDGAVNTSATPKKI